MIEEIQRKMDEMNHAIIQFRGFYSSWAKKHQISYHELLVLYSIREMGYCSLRQISQNYLLPRQTIHHTLSMMRKNQFLQLNENLSNGKEKFFVFTKKGHQYYDSLLLELSQLESQVVQRFGEDEMEQMTHLLQKLGDAFINAMEIEK